MKSRWFPVYVKSRRGEIAQVLASDAEQAKAIGRELFGSDFFMIADPTRLPEGAELLYHGVSRRRGEREWLVRFHGVEVHVFERHEVDGVRYRANAPGFGANDNVLALAVWSAARHVRSDEAEWFSRSVREGRPYYPTGAVFS